MLKEINISNFVIIDEINLTFSKTFNLITGETGSGKSIILDAIDVALGDKANNADIIKTGKDKASVELVFDISGNTHVHDILKDNEIDTDGELIISKELSAKSSRTRINGVIVNSSIIRQISPSLIERHAQSESVILLDDSSHREIIDVFGDSELPVSLNSLSKLYSEWSALSDKLNKAKNELSDNMAKKEFYEFQYNELTSASLAEADEEEKLSAEIDTLSNIDYIQSIVDKSNSILYEGADELPSIYTQLQELSKELDQVSASEISEPIVNLSSQLKSFCETMRGSLREVNSLKDKLFNDPEKLSNLNERLLLIQNLKRKYKVNNIEELISIRSKLEEDIRNINTVTNLDELELQVNTIYNKITELCSRITELRQKAGKILLSRWQEELNGLGLDNSKLEIDWGYGAEKKVHRWGYENPRFLFSANAGESIKPLSRTASGGELSRLLLAFHGAVASRRAELTLIFDEIDSGISGKTANSMAQKLYAMSKGNQLIVITHSPVIASMADIHYHIEKSSDDQMTVVRALKLNETEKIMNLAVMSSGSTSEKAIAYSKELIKWAKSAQSAN